MVYCGKRTVFTVNLNHIQTKIAVPMIAHDPIGTCTQKIVFLAGVHPRKTTGRFGFPRMGLHFDKHHLARIARLGNYVYLTTAIAWTWPQVTPQYAPSKRTQELCGGVLAPCSPPKIRKTSFAGIAPPPFRSICCRIADIMTCLAIHSFHIVSSFEFCLSPQAVATIAKPSVWGTRQLNHIFTRKS